MTLFELQDAYKEVAAMAENEEIDPQAVIDTLEAIAGEIEEKADNIACLIKSLDYESKAYSEEIKKLTEWKRAKEAKAARLKEYLFSSMQNLNIPKIETTRNKLSIRNNPPKVVISNIEALKPLSWAWKPHYLSEADIDKTELKLHLVAGEAISGATLEQGQSLQIK